MLKLLKIEFRTNQSAKKLSTIHINLPIKREKSRPPSLERPCIYSNRRQRCEPASASRRRPTTARGAIVTWGSTTSQVQDGHEIKSVAAEAIARDGIIYGAEVVEVLRVADNRALSVYASGECLLIVRKDTSRRGLEKTTEIRICYARGSSCSSSADLALRTLRTLRTLRALNACCTNLA